MAEVTPELIARLNDIKGLIYRYAGNLSLSGITTRIITENTYNSEPEKLFYWVQKNIAYKNDLKFAHKLISPMETIEKARIGVDCENHTILLGAMLKSRNWPIRFKVTATERPDKFDHIYLMVGYPKLHPVSWVPTDTTIKEPFGSEPLVLDSYIMEV